MQSALAKSIQPRQRGMERRNFKLVPPMPEGIGRSAVSAGDILKLKGMVRTLNEKLLVGRRIRGKTPTISREEERWVFGIRGAAMKEIEGLKIRLDKAKKGSAIPLEREISERELVIKLADQTIVLANQGMVYDIAWSVHLKRKGATRIDFEDLVATGNEAILRHAIRKFKPGKGFRFMTYAKHWVERDITDAANTWTSELKMPRRLPEDCYRVAAYRANHLAKHGKEPTDKQIAARASVSVERIIEYGMRNASCDLSLDELDGYGRPRLNKIPDGRAESVEEIALMKRVLEYALCRFPKIYAHYADLLACRYGTDIGDERTYDEAGEILGVSKQRVKQLEERAIGILATRLRRRDIDSFFD